MKEKKIEEFLSWLITESHYSHFFLGSFREEVKGKLIELVSISKKYPDVLPCDGCGCHPTVLIYTDSGRYCDKCYPNSPLKF